MTKEEERILIENPYAVFEKSNLMMFNKPINKEINKDHPLSEGLIAIELFNKEV